jgi:transcriptional regulator of acetoin/glycerol metabolism
VSNEDTLTPIDLGLAATAEMRAEEVPFEKTQIEMAILNANGSVSAAAEALGLSRQALYRRMEKLGVVLERRPR